MFTVVAIFVIFFLIIAIVNVGNAHAKKIRLCKNNNDNYYFTLSALKKRGWSDTLINEILVAPDKTNNNQNMSYFALTKFYEKARVIEAEKDERFISYQGPRKQRSLRTNETVKRKRDEIDKEIENLIITVEIEPLDMIYKNSLEAWDKRQSQLETQNGHTRYWKQPPMDVNHPSRQRWAVKYIRYNLVSYDYEVYKRVGASGGKKAIHKVLKKVFETIAEKYPNFKKECKKQYAQRY